MATENEKLCMAIINNSLVSNIDWNGVGQELNLKVNSAQKRWKRFKDASKAVKSTNGVDKKPANGAKTGKKRSSEEIDGMEEGAVRKLPARKSPNGKVKIQPPSSDEDGGEDWDARENDDKEFEGGVEDSDTVEV